MSDADGAIDPCRFDVLFPLPHPILSMQTHADFAKENAKFSCCSEYKHNEYISFH